jgi:hypothetical protein
VFKVFCLLSNRKKGYHIYSKGVDEMMEGDQAAAGRIKISEDFLPKKMYPHQVEALDAMKNITESEGKYRGLLVLPTGGGKTFTAVYWAHALIVSNTRPSQITLRECGLLFPLFLIFICSFSSGVCLYPKHPSPPTLILKPLPNAPYL